MMTEMIKDMMSKENKIPINKPNNTIKQNKWWIYLIFLLSKRQTKMGGD